MEREGREEVEVFQVLIIAFMVASVVFYFSIGNADLSDDSVILLLIMFVGSSIALVTWTLAMAYFEKGV
ncbi:hypothetical protein [Mechercharimyces sp. CAU 1602]|uniref:hypothetical protein n=1 Tax=Mechercharimyces sp. CAU 1602 TaxID=2973933 RepID=UPI002162D553|nr:hypothetical protein [Mechercharimyces sp. CAU 1602]